MGATVEDKAYAAGLFDGEGSISIAYTFRSRGYAEYILFVSISQQATRPLQWLLTTWGGSYRRLKKPGYMDTGEWFMRGSTAQPFLLDIHPYLKVKNRQVSLALNFIDTIGYKGFRITSDIKDLREYLRTQISFLNHSPIQEEVLR